LQQHIGAEAISVPSPHLTTGKGDPDRGSARLDFKEKTKGAARVVKMVPEGEMRNLFPTLFSVEDRGQKALPCNIAIVSFGTIGSAG
jgi:hypothetical protein